MKKYILTGILVSLLLIAITQFELGTKAYAQTTINGAGATFPFPLIDTWRIEYQNIKPDVNINYQSIGSGGGIKQFTEKTVDYGATDAPLTASDTEKLTGQAVHIPETIGSVVAAYNLPEAQGENQLKLTGPIIAEIFLGKINKWDDAKIKEINPDITLPPNDINVVHRSDGSGTTFVWTDYLSAVSPDWQEQIGKGKSVEWPAGVGAPGNEGVAATVGSNPYSIGYVELAYALTTGMDFAQIQNKEGNFITPSIDSTKVAVESMALTLPKGDESWESVSLVNAAGADSYPIASFTYLLLYKDLSSNPSIDKAKAQALVDFISWAITDGQQFAADLSYVPLPESIVSLNQQTLSALTFKGETLVK